MEGTLHATPDMLSVMCVENLPAIKDRTQDASKCKQFPLANLAALGVAFEPLASAVQAVTGGAGTSGMYWVNTKGLKMAQFQNSPDFLGSLLTKTGAVGGGQAAMTPLMCNPVMLCMAVVLMTVERKLDKIEQLQKEILEYLKEKEKAKIRGNINMLMDVLTNYKFNWNNDKFKTNKHILVQDIRKEAAQSIALLHDQIEKEEKKQGFIHGDQEVKTKLSKLQAIFIDYQLALYAYAFSSFLEVMLLENFDAAYLDSVSSQIIAYAHAYRTLYTTCYARLETLSKSSVQALLLKGIGGISKGVGGAIAKNAVLGKGQIDEGLIEAGSRIDSFSENRIGKTLDKFADNSDSFTGVFIDNIQTVQLVYNKPNGILFDAQSMYLLEA